MKVSGQTIVKQTLRGSIGERELLAFVRQTLAIPEGANVFFYARAPGIGDVGIDDEEPLNFTVSWEETHAPTPERTLPFLAFTGPEESTAPPG